MTKRRDLVRILQREGFVLNKSRGNHDKFEHTDGRTAIVPGHKELTPHTVESILKEIGLDASCMRGLR